MPPLALADRHVKIDMSFFTSSKRPPKARLLALALFNVLDVPNDRQPVLKFVQAIFVLGEIARQVRDLRVGVVIGDIAAVDPICRRLQHSAGRLGKRPAAKRTFALLVIGPFPDDQSHQIGNIGGGSKGILARRVFAAGLDPRLDKKRHSRGFLLDGLLDGIRERPHEAHVAPNRLGEMQLDRPNLKRHNRFPVASTTLPRFSIAPRAV